MGTERQSKLTQYGVGKKEWEALAEGNDLNVYLACDSDTTSTSCDEVNYMLRNKRKIKKIVKGVQIRKALGLNEFDSATEIDNQNNEKNSKGKDKIKKNGKNQIKKITKKRENNDIDVKVTHSKDT